MEGRVAMPRAAVEEAGAVIPAGALAGTPPWPDSEAGVALAPAAVPAAVPAARADGAPPSERAVPLHTAYSPISW